MSGLIGIVGTPFPESKQRKNKVLFSKIFQVSGVPELGAISLIETFITKYLERLCEITQRFVDRKSLEQQRVGRNEQIER